MSSSSCCRAGRRTPSILLAVFLILIEASTVFCQNTQPAQARPLHMLVLGDSILWGPRTKSELWDIGQPLPEDSPNETGCFNRGSGLSAKSRGSFNANQVNYENTLSCG